VPKPTKKKKATSEYPNEVDYEKKIETLEEELRRKEETIERLKEENILLLKTALKNSERRVDTKLRKQVNYKGEP